MSSINQEKKNWNKNNGHNNVFPLVKEVKAA
jgi:hypothetical protein